MSESDGWYLMGDGEPRKLTDEEAAALRDHAATEIGERYLLDLRGGTATMWPALAADERP